MTRIVPRTAQELDELVAAFVAAAEHAGLSVPAELLQAEFLPAPHRPPSKLPFPKQAIYWFSVEDRCLKVGKAGPQSGARYTSQHYNPNSSRSNLAKSILRHKERLKAVVPDQMRDEVDGLNEHSVGAWIKANTSRCNLLVDPRLRRQALSFLETFVQTRLQPLFEGRMD